MMPRTHAGEERTWSGDRGTWRHDVVSPYQTGTNSVEVLVPAALGGEARGRVLYLLPVEAGEKRVFGDPMALARQLRLADRHGLIVVVPTFDVAPWYGNHATDPRQRQDDYLVKTVIPLIDRCYPTSGDAEGRLLLGFSKSGWGAVALLLRHPGVFGYAASWDAPLLLTERQFGIWQTDATFGTPENMARSLPTTLLRASGGPFRERTRLVVAGERLFGTFTDRRFPYDGPPHTAGAHALMDQLGVRHVYLPDLPSGHRWNAHWMAPVTEALVKLPEISKP